MSTATRHFSTPLSNLALFHKSAEPLSERQRRALAGLAAGQPITAAAGAAGVHRSSLHSWLARDPAFRAAHAALSRLQADSAADLASILRAGLQALITDPAAPFDIRLRAIQTALKAVQALPVADLLPDLGPAPAAPLPDSVEPLQPPAPQPPAPDFDPEPGAASHATARNPDNIFSDSVLATPPGAAGVPHAGYGTTPRFRSTPRNAACPCGSKLKFKRCCGKEAPRVVGG